MVPRRRIRWRPAEVPTDEETTVGEGTPPPPLQAVEDLLNTLDVEGGVDHLDTPEGLVGVLDEHGLASVAAPDVAASDLDAARRLRDGLRALAEANAHGDEPDQQALDELNRLIGELGVRPRVAAADEVRLTSDREGIAGALARLLGTVIEAMADGSWQRVKICGNDECRWAFWDASRNRSGRWCTMAVCGNRMKVRAFRERHADPPGPARTDTGTRGR